MGSLDAYLVAGAFALLGESVLAVRVVQVALFAAVLLTGYAVGLRFSGDRQTALLATMMLAFPPVLLTLYTTASLGGYGEALLAGNLLLWWGHRLGCEDARRRGLWLVWGLVAGLGFWTLGLVLVYLVPVSLWLLWRLRARPWQGCLLAALGFAAGSMGPKVRGACDFVRETGQRSVIGQLSDLVAIMKGEAGTLISNDIDGIIYADH